MLRCFLFLILAAGSTAGQQKLLSPSDIVKLPSKAANEKVAYGKGPMQYAELRLPEGKGPFPLVIVIHGGCWAEYADASYTAHLASALTEQRWATWNLQYRRLNDEGGGWPATFLDVGAGMDAARDAAKKYGFDLNRVVVIGHSSGGHLALWAAGRARIPRTSELYVANPLPVKGVVSMAGVADLRAFVDYGRKVCGDRHLRVMGGTPEEQPARYAAASPAELLPLKTSQVLIWGGRDRAVPESVFQDYERRVKELGDPLEIVQLEESGHHDMNSAEAPSWAKVVEAIRRMMEK